MCAYMHISVSVAAVLLCVFVHFHSFPQREVFRESGIILFAQDVCERTLDLTSGACVCQNPQTSCKFGQWKTG